MCFLTQVIQAIQQPLEALLRSEAKPRAMWHLLPL